MIGLRILVVEGDAPMAELLCEQLCLEGHQPERASDEAGALRVLAEGGVDVVLSDVRAFPRDGFGLLASVRERWPGVPVVLTVVFPTADTERRALEAGALGLLAKPLEPDALRGLLERAFPGR